VTSPEPTHAFDEAYWTQASQYRKFEDYATALAALRRWNQGFMRLVTPHLPAFGRHLDAGCGHGAIVHELLDRGWDAHGFDASAWMVAAAHRHAPALADRFAEGQLPDVPFEGRFELVTCLEVLEHIADPLPSLVALADRLVPGGRLIASTPNLRPLMPWRDTVAADPTHVSVHEPAWWRGALEHAGLRPVHVGTFVATPLLWRLHSDLAPWVPLGPRVGPGLLLVAEAPLA
jgi:2-polyprenyl-3-methyl-5-hydroxy-6-metoxy-1,4-benzoquinol methylase